MLCCLDKHNKLVFDLETTDGKKKKIIFVWNKEIGNFCLTKKVNRQGKRHDVFIEPFQYLTLKPITDKMSFAEALQSIFYKRYGGIDYRIGVRREYDIALAKEMGVY